MNYYLVDYENVNSQGLEGISSLTNNDTVIIFYSENADTMTFGLHLKLNETAAAVQYQCVDVGQKNALDFQLSSYLGFLICDNLNRGDCKYYIVTNDHGFSCLSNYWKKINVNVDLICTLSGSSCNTVPQKALKDELVLRVEELLPKEHRDKADNIAAIIRQSKDKVELHNTLVKQYPSQNHRTAQLLYKQLKQLITK